MSKKSLFRQKQGTLRMFCVIFLPQRQITLCLHRIKNLRQRNLVNKTSKCLRQNLLKTQKAEMRKKHKHKRLLLQRAMDNENL